MASKLPCPCIHILCSVTLQMSHEQGELISLLLSLDWNLICFGQ